jgi:hypothetical protein
MTGDYLDWIADRNSAEVLWQTNVNVAHALQAGSQATARQTLAVNNAAAALARDTSLANARFTYVAALTAPAKTYVDATALAHRNHTVALATALRDYTIDETQQRQQTYQNALNAAQAGHNILVGAAEGPYRTAQGTALSTRWTTETNARHLFATSTAANNLARETADAHARRNYEVTDANEYVALTTTLAGLDESYWTLEATTLDAMAGNLATSSGTPWAAQYAAQQNAYESWSNSAAGAEETERVTAAQEQRDGEIGLADAERDAAIAGAAADYAQVVSVANASQAAGLAQAAAVAFGGSNASLPELATVTVSSTEYAIAAAPIGDYAVSIASVPGTWGYGYFGYGFGYGFGGYYNPFGYGLGGFFGGGYVDPYYYQQFGFYSAYFGFGGLHFFGAYGQDVTLLEPAELVLPAGFWNIAGQAADVVQRIEQTLPASISYGLIAFSHADLDVAAAGLAPEPGAPLFSVQAVAEFLERLNPAVAAFWSAYGRFTSSFIPARPSSDNSADSLSTLIDEPGHAHHAPESNSKAENKIAVSVPSDASSSEVASYLAYSLSATGGVKSADGQRVERIQRTVREYIDEREGALAGEHEPAKPAGEPAALSLADFRASELDPNWPRLTDTERLVASGGLPWYYPFKTTHPFVDAVWERTLEDLGREARFRLTRVYTAMAKFGAMAKENLTQADLEDLDEQFEDVLNNYDFYVQALIEIEKTTERYFNQGLWFAGTNVVALIEKLHAQLPPTVEGITSPYLVDLAKAGDQANQAAGKQLSRTDTYITALEVTNYATIIASVLLPVAAGVRVVATQAAARAVAAGASASAARAAAAEAAVMYVARQGAIFAAGQIAARRYLPPLIEAAGLNEYQVQMGLALIQGFSIARQIKAPSAAPVSRGAPAGIGKQSARLSAQDKTLIDQVQNRLRELREIANNNVAAGRATGRNADLLANTPTNSSAYSRRYGNAIHDEFFKLIEADATAGELGKMQARIITNKGAVDVKAGFANTFSGKRPDVRLDLGNGREAVWDLTTKAEAAKSNLGHGGNRYGGFGFVDYIADLVYTRL